MQTIIFNLIWMKCFTVNQLLFKTNRQFRGGGNNGELFGNAENKESITSHFQKDAAHVLWRLNLALSRDSGRPLYAKDASHVISWQMCGTVCLFRTGVCIVNTAKTAPKYMRAKILILSVNSFVYMLNLLKILHEVNVVKISYILRNFLRSRCSNTVTVQVMQNK